MIRSKPASSMQKTYDDCYLMCSTAVYFESQNNEPDALRSWREALDAIYYHNAYKIPSGWRPRTETEKALQESLRQMELRCKERVDLLDALRESRETAKKSSNSDLPKVGLSSPENDGLSEALTPGWLGGGSVPPADYASIPKPAPPPPLPARNLPKRPSFMTRKSSSKDLSKQNSSPNPVTSSAFSPPSTSMLAPERPDAVRRGSRTPSPEKRLLRTLRAGKNGKESGKMASSMRPKPPAAAKAATQAWGSTAFGSSEISLVGTNGEGRSSRQGKDRASIPAMSRRRSNHERTKHTYAATDRTTNIHSGRSSTEIPRRPAGVRHQSSAASLGSTASLSHEESHSDPPAYEPESPAPPVKPTMSMPAYRQEYLPPPPSKYTKPPVATPPRRWDQRATSAPTNSAQPPSPSYLKHTAPHTHSLPRKAVGVVTATQQRQQLDDIPDEGLRPRTAPARPRPRPVKSANNADPRPQSTSSPDDAQPQSSSDDVPLTAEEEWQRKKKRVLKSLPANIDPAAAKQILNEVVIRGDPVQWSDISGLATAKLALKENVIYPFLRPDLFRGLREPARGILLFGPPGTGKTMLARAVATESRSAFFSIGASSLTSKFLGESEKLVRALFAVARMCGPSIVFIDEIESLLGRRGEGGHEALERVKTEFLVGWSDLQRAAAGAQGDDEEGDASRVLVLAATNLPWLIDEAARRRFVRRQYIPLPEGEVRRQQLEKLLERQKHALSVLDLDRLVVLTDGFSGSDITSLAKDAAMGPLRALGERLLDMSPDDIRPIGFEDFEASLVNIRPSVSKAGLKEFEDWAAEFGERGG
ncbi:AAA-domain-containing protein [Myriangium duriaei CBS 260.36]|uniref:AAA-domain-containing protein n=1 Tax=Myriangium duriaei CBS 260.36 TaxID=1168546 RepID=A0A9P4MQ02_9PEZI|nr:AAA-domain-containing protein [Myriangium duriaei CBS 260.36]